MQTRHNKHRIYDPHTGKTRWFTDRQLKKRQTFPNLRELEPRTKIKNPLPGNGLFEASRGEIEVMLSRIGAKL